MTSPRDRYEAGKKLRKRLPRDAQSRWEAPRASPADRLATLSEVNKGRLSALLPEKYKRMRVSPFSFFRGAAVLMASDLATLPRTGAIVQLCGDAHVRNLGAYAAPDGTLVFDINDFDETIPGPWEWDVKRLATSLVLAAEESGEPERRQAESVRRFVASYRESLRRFASMPYRALGRHLIIRRRDDLVLEEIFADAQRTTPARNLKKLANVKAGKTPNAAAVGEEQRFRFHDRTPDLEHVSDHTAAEVLASLRAYRSTLSASRRRTFERYRAVDVAFKLVGTGSVGTRDFVVLLFGNGVDDPLFIQVKQELPSCYAAYLPSAPRAEHEGQRVADGQMMMQTLSDPFLGYTRFGGHDYLVRQLADHKAALDPSELRRETLFEYATLCGEVLAKGHARTGDAALLAGYVGKSSRLDKAIAAFALKYAEQTKADYRVFIREHRAHGAGLDGRADRAKGPRRRGSA